MKWDWKKKEPASPNPGGGRSRKFQVGEPYWGRMGVGGSGVHSLTRGGRGRGAGCGGLGGEVGARTQRLVGIGFRRVIETE